MEDKWIKLESRGITAVSGFRASGISCGIKNGKKDLAAIYSDPEAKAAGVFTRNLVQAAPVKLCRSQLENPIRFIVINSGNANACTGEQGTANAMAMAEKVGTEMDIDPGRVMVCSTGVIGMQLPMEKINSGISRALKALDRGKQADSDFAEAILTTDTKIKQSAYRCATEQGTFHLAGAAKGSGMICPNMATMLAFLATDVNINRSLLQKLFNEAVSRTFNVISVDGETSTNDTALILANGRAEGVNITETGLLTDHFRGLLERVCRELALQIVEDGEGLTKVITLTIKGARDEDSARVLSRSVLNSPLVKTAFYGEDANWGRILAALGYAGIDLNPELVDIFIGPFQVAANGGSVPFSEAEMKKILQKRDVPVLIDLKQGSAELTAWGTDLSHEYITINSDYRS